MDQIQGPFAIQMFVPGIFVGSAEQQEILPVPPHDFIIVPDPCAKAIDNTITVFAEGILPISGPLLVPVICAALTWNRCGEKNQRS
jgi:hypothetical protein